MWKWLTGLLVVVITVLIFGYFSLDKNTRNLMANLPTDRDVLFWSTPQRDAAFRRLDWMPILAEANVIESGDTVFPLPQGQPISIHMDVEAYMREQRTAGLVIVQAGKIRLEKYGLDFDAKGLWTSFSVAKSFTSTLVGAAIRDGFIDSINDKVSD